MTALPQRCRVVLVRPRNPLNIGACARAMANFGFRDLAVVDAWEPSWEEARKPAMGGGRVLAGACLHESVAKAVAGRTLVIGTSSGWRRSLEIERTSLNDLATRIGPRDKVAVLFGSEKTGLSNDELSYCHIVTRVPTSPECSSMNLGQAVAVCCYQLSRGAVPVPGVPRTRAAPAEALEKLREEFQEVLIESGYIHRTDRPSDTLKLRRLLLRLNISARDVATLRGMVHQIAWKIGSSDK